MPRLINFLVFSIDDDVDISVDVVPARSEKAAERIACQLGRDVVFSAGPGALRLWLDWSKMPAVAHKNELRSLAGHDPHNLKRVLHDN